MPPKQARSAASAQTQLQDSSGSATPTVSASQAQAANVNRKKAKRRQKQAAKLAAEHGGGLVQGQRQTPRLPYNGYLSQQSPDDDRTSFLNDNGLNADYDPSDPDDQFQSQNGDEVYYSDEEVHFTNDGLQVMTNGQSKKKKKKRGTSNSQSMYEEQHLSQRLASHFSPPPPPPPPLNAAHFHSAHVPGSTDKIWNTSTAEERDRIKEFWLSLEETERRSLVKVEKEAVLKKMKEQQKHSCSCSVCGRKRTAIEEELEVLYDAYYEELEQYAEHQQDGTPPEVIAQQTYPTIGRFPSTRGPALMNIPRPERAQIHEILEDEDDGDEEEYSDEDESADVYSDDEYDDEPKGPAADFFNFGNSLTVQGGILTVADDLLKNDGKKFIEMMEQLAERRMQREEEAQYAMQSGRYPGMPGHTHGPPIDEDDYDEDGEAEEDYVSEDDGDYEEDEMEELTDEQRMEEGRRMFQIFAARMFEQRVLSAYREKVSLERQEKLLEEIENESALNAQREAKKAKELQKKKDKKKAQKQAKDEERARKEAEKAAAETALKAAEEKKAEEQRLKKEEQRRKREAEKKALEEERQRREADKQRKAQEAREQQAELERKQREAKEKARKEREEAKKREKGEREAKEREAKERKEQEAAERREREATAKMEKEAKEQSRREEQGLKPIAATPAVPVSVPALLRKSTSSATSMPPTLQHTPNSHASPHLSVATPVIPKAPSPARPRQTSHQSSHHSSPKSSQVPSTSSATSPSTSSSQAQMPHAGALPNKYAVLPPSSQPFQPSHQSQPSVGPPPGMHPQNYPNMMSPGLASHPFPSPQMGMPPGLMQRPPMGHENHHFQQQQQQQQQHPYHHFSGPPNRGYPAPNGLPFPPGINGIKPGPPGRIGHIDSAAAQGALGGQPTPGQFVPGPSAVPSSHSRNGSLVEKKNSIEAPPQPITQPIARPNPIKRPSSTQHGTDDNERLASPDVDELSKHLGSSALLDDVETTSAGNRSSVHDNRRVQVNAGGPHRPTRLGFNSPSMFNDPMGSAKGDGGFPRGMPSSTWGTPQLPYGSPALSNQPPWSTPTSAGWSNNSGLGGFGVPLRHPSRPVAVRIMALTACKQLSQDPQAKNNNGFLNIDTVLRHVNMLKLPNEQPIQPKELLDICDTEGDAHNGGGSFQVQDRGPGAGLFVKFEPDNMNGLMGGARMGPGVPGDIGSPIVGHSQQAAAAASSSFMGVARGFVGNPPPGSGVPTGF